MAKRRRNQQAKKENAANRSAESLPMEMPLVHAVIMGWMVATLTTFVAECLFLLGLHFELSWSSGTDGTRIQLAALAAFIATISGLISLILGGIAFKFSSFALPWQVGWVAGAIAALGLATSLRYLF